MQISQTRKLVADLLKNPNEAQAFLRNSEQYLSDKGITTLEKDKKVLISIVESWLKKDTQPINQGGHTNLDTHTDYNASDGHVNRNSHTDHTSSY